MTLHCLGFPHTRLDGGYETCAYTQKLRKFTRMGFDTVTYMPGGDVDVVESADTPDLNVMPAWPSEAAWQEFNEAALKPVRARITPGDFLLCFAGISHRYVADNLDVPGVIVCEPGVGYEGIFTDFCAFESYAWQHYVYGKTGIQDGRYFDRVIPNFFDPADFPALNNGDGDYLLFVGRVTPRKGLQAAVGIAEEMGMTLAVAGPCDAVNPADRVTLPDWVEYLGPVDATARAAAMSGAACLLAPTSYVEPFGGVAVEAMMCGTPVVATDWGAFTETVVPGETGYRFRTLAEACDAVAYALALDPCAIRDYADARYSLEAVAPLFTDWFSALDSLRGDGWYTRRQQGVTA